MSASDEVERLRLSGLVDALGADLPSGLIDHDQRDAFVGQLVDSVRRVRYLALVSRRSPGPRSIDPGHPSFDPLRALVHHRNIGDHDEACWLAFIHTHFGKNKRWGWEYPRRIYGALGGQHWSWKAVRSDSAAFRDWLASNEAELQAGPGGFGNHRKYESLSASSERGTGAVVESYVLWIAGHGDHSAMVDAMQARAHGDPFQTFELMVTDVKANVVSFGRTASFDYVNLLSWMGLAPARAGRCHIAGSTGPLRGAELLVGPGYSADDYEDRLAELCDRLQVTFDVMEDALCNWQKNPSSFKPFRG